MVTAQRRRAVEMIANMDEWDRSVPKGHGLGIAVHRGFASYRDHRRDRRR
jgi:isoquinoline 1-oxidoreductase beta subunit